MFAARVRRDGAMFYSSKAVFIRWMLPYGRWTCADGREVLFDRDYTPICQRTPPGPVSLADPKEWVRHIDSQRFYDDDGTSERRKKVAALAALTEWGFVEPVLAQVEDLISSSKTPRGRGRHDGYNMQDLR